MARLGSQVVERKRIWLASVPPAVERAVLGFVFSLLELDIGAIDTQLRENAIPSLDFSV